MNNPSLLYPFCLLPRRKTLVWGTEDWTVSAIPGAESIVSNGACAGHSLSEVIAQSPEAILGKHIAARYGSQLPLLTKIISAQRDLSIQVHPNDAMAQRLYGKNGKSEMWYVLDAQSGAYLYSGFKEELTPEEYARKVTDGTIVESLAKHEVHPGDVFYLPAGHVHSIGAGITLAEIQQSSDVTYRIYDYNRPGLDGKPRELHTDLAAQALDFTVLPDYRTVYQEGGDGVTLLLDTPYFVVSRLRSAAPLHRNLLSNDSFVILMNIGRTDCLLRPHALQADTLHPRAIDAATLLPAGHSCLLPAALADYELLPTSSSHPISLLETLVP